MRERSTVAEPSVRVLRCGAVATIEFASSGQRNSWDASLDELYAAALDEVDGDSSIRVVVLRGAGRHFCAGRAVDGLKPQPQSGGPRQSYGIDLTRHARKPIIAAIHGSCAGIGLTLALLCDIRFAADSARFSTAFVRRGLVSGHATGWLLQRQVGHGHAAELMLSGRKLDGMEAARIGLVNSVVPEGDLDAFVAEYADDLATHASPRSMWTIKEQLAEDERRGYDEALRVALALTEDAFGSSDFAEGVASYRERRPPRFAGLAPVDPDSSDAASGRPE